MSTTTSRARRRLAAGIVALAFLEVTTACGEQNVVDQPAGQPTPQARPSVQVYPGPPPAIRDGSRPAGVRLGRDFDEAQRRVAQHATRYHGSPGPGR